MKTSAPKQSGFTLVEMMVVIGIVGLLVSIALPQVLVPRDNARGKVCINNLRQIDAAKQQWALEKKKTMGDAPMPEELQPYLNRGMAGFLPTCPADPVHSFDTSYTINDLRSSPVCHVSPALHVIE